MYVIALFKGKYVMCGQVWWPHTLNLYSAFNLFKCTPTHQWVVGRHTAGGRLCCSTQEQLGVRCLAQGSYLSCGYEGGESAGHYSPRYNPKTRTRNLWVTSPNLYPLGHNCPFSLFFQKWIYNWFWTLCNFNVFRAVPLCIKTKAETATTT